jgi:hypothetical protein
MLRRIKIVEQSVSVIEDLLYNEIKDEQDKVRVLSYKRGLNKAIHMLRYS